MKSFLYIILFLSFSLGLQAQSEFHVFPKQGNPVSGSATGNGSLEQPWDLQTALSQPSTVVNGGDTIWLHDGIYNGRFVSTIKSTNSKKIKVTSFQNEKVILNGNIPNSKRVSVLTVNGGNVIFKDFDITCLNMTKDPYDPKFQSISGLFHTSGEDCEFINLKVYNNTSLGIGSWRLTGGSIFDGCKVYNNGHLAKTGKGSGEGFYVHNQSNKTRIIRNCIIFNNYYKGIEVWSANRKADFSYVKHITIENNIIFNNGLPAGFSYDNIIVASDDRNGVNRAIDVKILDNVLYHNTDYANNQINGNAPSLTIGYHASAPAEDIVVKNNFILGRNNALRILHAKSLQLQNNTIYSGYILFSNALPNYVSTWDFDSNNYFTKKITLIRTSNKNTHTLSDWQSEFGLDKNSEWKNKSYFELQNVLDITQNQDHKNNYRVTLFDEHGKTVSVDFSDYNIEKNTPYQIRNIASEEIIASGTMDESNKINFPMGTHNNTASNFGVYDIVFDVEKKEERARSFFSRFFKWLF